MARGTAPLPTAGDKARITREAHMDELDRPPIYPADRAANVVIVMAVAVGLICAIAGILRIRADLPMGWLLVLLGIVPPALAIVIRIVVSRK